MFEERIHPLGYKLNHHLRKILPTIRQKKITQVGTQSLGHRHAPRVGVPQKILPKIRQHTIPQGGTQSLGHRHARRVGVQKLR